MATLFERIAGTSEEATKIPIHIFVALLREFKDGRVTGQEAAALMGLDAGNTADVQWLIAALTASANKSEMLRMIKDHFYLAEWNGTKASFTDEAFFYQKLQQQITDEGGTPPAR